MTWKDAVEWVYFMGGDVDEAELHRLCFVSDDPTSYKAAVHSSEAKNWKVAMQEELNSLLEYDT